MIKLKTIRTGKNTSDYEMRDGSHLIRLTNDKEFGSVSASAWVNDGETICRSRTFKTLAGAQRWGNQWLEGMR